MPDREALGYEGGARGARAARAPLSAADCPLEAMREEHFRQRQFCVDMETLAATTVARPALALALLTNLCRDRPMHHRDEDEGLFPRLRRRAKPCDEVGPLLDRLSREHSAAPGAVAALAAALACMADGALPAPEDREALRTLAQAERRHMTIENAVVLPLARLRLTAQDRAALLAGMRARRSPAAPGDGHCPDLSGRAGAAR
jgi:hypothetical protein